MSAFVGHRAEPWSFAHRALVPLLLFLACALGQAGCDDGPPGGDTQPGADPEDVEHPLLCPKADAASVAWPKDDLPLAETPSAGKIAGSFSVSAAGEARYAMPLVVPPGRAGVEPKLALTYTSSQGQGIAGMGFALEGLSAITRCPSNLAQDGEIRAVQFNGLDKLCLDGARLVEVGSAPGAAGGTDHEYRTFPDTFVKVIGHVPAHTSAALSFEVFTKQGHILEYGATPNSRAMAKGGVIASWWITSRSDRRGNAIAYTYINDKHPTQGHTVELSPLRIEYTSHPTMPASRAVVFEYEDTPPHTTYAGGVELRRSKRLQKISMRAPIPPSLAEGEVRRYELTYEKNPATWRTVLTTIAECAGNVCKPPTRFSWSRHDKELTFKQTLLPTPPPWFLYDEDTNPPQTRAHWTLADVTGDGLDDMVFSHLLVDEPIPESWFTNDWQTAKNTGTGGLFAPFSQAMTVDLKAYESLSDAGPPCAGDEHAPACAEAAPWWGVPFDYDMYGRRDFLLDPPDSIVPTWEVARSVGDGTFEKIDTGIPRHNLVGSVLARMHHGSLLADVDGDGAADLIQCFNPTFEGLAPSDRVPVDVGAEWSVHLWRSGVGFDPVSIPIGPMQGRTCILAQLGERKIKLVDLDGDGKTELLVPAKGIFENDHLDNPCTSECVFSVVAYHENGTFSTEPTSLPVNGWGSESITFPDVNGDGLPDAVLPGFADKRFRTYLNTGKGFATPILSVANALPNDSQLESYYASYAQPFDYNGDGNMDLLVPMEGKCVNADPLVPCWVVLQARASGDGTFDLVKLDIPLSLAPEVTDDAFRARPLRVADLDGNGRPDLVIQDPFFFSAYMAQGPQDLLISVTDGLSPLDPGDAGFLPTVAITYDLMVDRAITYGYPAGSAEREGVTYSSSRYDLGSEIDCAYPRHCVVGPQRVVSKYELFDAANHGSENRARVFRMKYRDGRAHLLGRGWLGFGARIVNDVDTGAGTNTVYDNVTYDPQLNTYPFAGHGVRSWSWSAPLSAPPDADRIQLGYEVTQLEQRLTNGGKTYFTMPVAHDAKREEGTSPGPGQTVFQYVQEKANNPALVLSHTSRVVTDYDDYGDVLAETESTEGVDLTTVIARTFDNDPATWLIGLVQTEATCSTSIGKTQCRNTLLERNAFGEVTKASAGDPTDPETHLTTSYKRDVFGNIMNAKAKDAFGHAREVCTSYEPEGIFPFARKNRLGHVTFARFDLGLGVATAAVDANGLLTRWQHDGFGRIAKEVRADGTKTKATLTRAKNGGPWGNWWNLKSGLKVDGGEETKTEIDSRGRAVHTWTRGPSVGACDAWICADDPWFESEAQFDHLARRVKVSLPWLSGTSPAAKRYNLFAHDGLGRVVKHTTPWSSVTTTRFDGNTSTATDSAGKTVVEVDAFGRPVKIVDAMQGITTYGYGPFGALWTVTRPGDATSITERDAYGRVRVEKDPDRGTTITHYDGFGEATSLSDALGRDYLFTYDKIGRLVERVDSDGTTKWKYDTAAHGIGLLAETTSPVGHTTTRTYDTLSRPLTTTLSLDGETFSSELAYDNFGRIKRIAYPTALGIDPVVARRSYDDRGYLVEIRDTQQKLLWQLDQVDGAGRVTKETFGSDVQTHTEYVAEKGTVKRIRATLGIGHKAVPIQDLHYAHNERLNLTSRTDALQKNALGLVKSESFGYDELDRLACAELTEIQITGPLDDKRGPANPKKDPNLGPCDGITYFPNGNIKTKTGVGAYTYDPAQPHAAITAGPDSFTYDAVGNQRERPGATIDYTAFDLPSEVTLTNSGEVITFAYDGAQQRIRKTTPTRETVYFGGIYERVVDAAAGAEHRFYVDAGSAKVVITARHHQKAEKTFVHKDLLGSADVITNDAGAVTDRRSFDAFGQRRNPDWGQPMFGSFSSDDTLGFTGHEPDDELGLVNARGRIYDPKIGRFLSTDPIVSRPLFSQSWNPYSYVTNNPLKFIDPSGFMGEEIPESPSGGSSWGPPVATTDVSPDLLSRLQEMSKTWNAATPPSTPTTPPATPVDDATAKTAGEPLDAATPTPPSIGSWANFVQGLKYAAKHGPMTAPPTDEHGHHDYRDNEPDESWAEWKASWSWSNLLLGHRKGESVQRSGDPLQDALNTPPSIGIIILPGELAPGMRALPAEPVAPTGGGILRAAGNGSWISRGGLRYGEDPNFGNRVRHVLQHASDIPGRPGRHGVFDAGREGALGVVDEAWAMAQRGGSGVSVSTQGARTAYTVDMGRRVGFVGGQAGAAAGSPAASHVRLVLEGTDVITAFPVVP